MIFQDPMTSLNPLFTVENQLTEPLKIHRSMDKHSAREKALEFFEENQRYYDVKHWKHPEIGTKILGGPMTEISFYTTDGLNTMDALISYWDAYSYTGYWHPKWFLEPFRQDEVNKGIIAQNPGY